jgi:transketolase
VEIHTIKPLDRDLILEGAEQTGAMVTAEEHSVSGGLGGALAGVLAAGQPTPLETVGIDSTFGCTAPDTQTLMDFHELAVDDIIGTAKRVLSRK